MPSRYQDFFFVSFAYKEDILLITQRHIIDDDIKLCGTDYRFAKSKTNRSKAVYGQVTFKVSEVII